MYCTWISDEQHIPYVDKWQYISQKQSAEILLTLHLLETILPNIFIIWAEIGMEIFLNVGISNNRSISHLYFLYHFFTFAAFWSYLRNWDFSEEWKYRKRGLNTVTRFLSPIFIRPESCDSPAELGYDEKNGSAHNNRGPTNHCSLFYFFV